MRTRLARFFVRPLCFVDPNHKTLQTACWVQSVCKDLPQYATNLKGYAHNPVTPTRVRNGTQCKRRQKADAVFMLEIVLE